MTGRALAGSGLVLGILLAGCGSGPGIRADVADDLERRVGRVSTAIEKREYTGAQTELDRLTAEVAEAQADGALTRERAARIRTAADAVSQDLRAVRAGTAAEDTSAPRTSPPGAEASGGTSGRQGKPEQRGGANGGDDEKKHDEKDHDEKDHDEDKTEEDKDEDD